MLFTPAAADWMLRKWKRGQHAAEGPGVCEPVIFDRPTSLYRSRWVCFWCLEIYSSLAIPSFGSKGVPILDLSIATISIAPSQKTKHLVQKRRNEKLHNHLSQI